MNDVDTSINLRPLLAQFHGASLNHFAVRAQANGWRNGR
jgi:hypothetical protein